MRVSVIVTTYNRPAALARVLTSLRDQTVLPYEVVVADDGSREPTAGLIGGFQKNFPVPLRHAWHPDEGFRLSAVRNLAASQASGQWLHFLDGDCVPQVSLVERIGLLAEAGWMLAGDRILLSESLTASVEAQAQNIHLWTAAQWHAQKASGGINRTLPLKYWPHRFGRGFRKHDWSHFRTANVGIARDAFEKINGFEAAMQGWGLEDSEFAVRALNAGLRIRSGRMALGVFHLWHREQSREALEENRILLRQSIETKAVRARNGLAERSA